MGIDYSTPVVIVDDYRTMLRIIGNLLMQIGFRDIRAAGDGHAALDMLRERPAGLIISDWNMEPMSGFELLRSVRADALLRHIPFIMVTAESKTENVLAARQAGVDNYIVKPFNAATLRSKIDSALGARAAA